MEDFASKFARLKDQIDQELMAAAPRTEPRSLYDPIHYFLGIGGKRLRPILLLLSAEAAGGGTDSALEAAIAIELLHNFTLVHDDIMDDDDLRRGSTTVHVKWDDSVAILAGDGLIGLAYRHLLQLPTRHITPICQIFTEGVIEVCEGQAFDKEFETLEQVSLNEYFRMIGKKTGRLITMATQIGGILGDGTDEVVDILKNYGSIIGTAFQIQDDLLDIMASEEVIGKTFGSDVMAGKKTYLMVKALELAESSQKERVMEILHSENISSDMLADVQKIFRETDIITEAQEEIQNYFIRANHILDKLPNQANALGLRKFSEMLLNREY